MSERLLGRETIRRLVGAVRSFAGSEVGGRAKMLAVLLLALLLGISALNVLNSYVSRYFMTAIERREWSEFVRMAVFYLVVFAGLTAVSVFYRFVEERLGLLWRDWLTRRLVGLYLQDRTYYRLNAAGTLGNPDQRIADDVRAFTTSTLSIALIFLNGTFTIIAFSGVLWSISRVLFLTAVAYAVFGSVIAVILGRPLVRLNYDQSDREANFRSHLIHVRENAESVALLHREPHVSARLHGYVDSITSNLRHIITVNRNLGFFTTGYDYLIQIIPVLIVAPLFIRGQTEFGTIPQSTMAFAHLLGAFSLVVKQFPQLSTYAAVLARLSALASATESAAGRSESRIAVVEDPGRLAFDHLTLENPNDGQPLVRELSVEVPAAARTLISTPSDAEMEALQRAVAGIWESGEGRIIRPPIEQVLLVPDRPYLPPGTLRALLGRADGSAVPDDAIREALETVGMDAVVKRMGGIDVERNWDDALSLEEQRLLSVARILIAKPRFAMLAQLDESLGAERAMRFIDALVERGVGCVLVGESALGREQFDVVIEIEPNGGWVKKRDTRVVRPTESKEPS